MAPTQQELKEARAKILRECARPSTRYLFSKSAANDAAARRLRDEGLITVEDSEDDAGVRYLVLALTAKAPMPLIRLGIEPMPDKTDNVAKLDAAIEALSPEHKAWLRAARWVDGTSAEDRALLRDELMLRLSMWWLATGPHGDAVDLTAEAPKAIEWAMSTNLPKPIAPPGGRGRAAKWRAAGWHALGQTLLWVRHWVRALLANQR